MKSTKRILTVKVERMDDPDQDTSYMGEYSNRPTSEFSIDRRHTLNCRVNLETLDDVEDHCTCDGDNRGRNIARYFNPATVGTFDPKATWIPETETEKRAFWQNIMRNNARQDYERMERYVASDWGFIGISAKAEIRVGDTLQTITSGGLWGIESDSEESYLKEIEQEQLGELRAQLYELGFSKRAIAAAVHASGD